MDQSQDFSDSGEFDNFKKINKKTSTNQFYITDGTLYVHYNNKTLTYFISDKLNGACVWDRTTGENFLKETGADKKGLYLTELSANPSKYHVNKSQICAVCGIISTLCCSKCKYIFYCSKEHQLMHWQSHKNDCGTSFFTF